MNLTEIFVNKLKIEGVTRDRYRCHQTGGYYVK